MYTKDSAKKMLRKVNEVINGSLYGDMENLHNYNYSEYVRIKRNLERMLK